MTKADFIKSVDEINSLEAFADDTSRTPAERDLARILQMSSLLLLRGDKKSAEGILKIYLEEVGKSK
jgi:hypothetical protein